MRPSPPQILPAALVVVAALSLWATPASATAITVTTLGDEFTNDGDCSLREAIWAADNDMAFDECAAGSGADMVSVPAGLYMLSIPVGGNDPNTGDLDVTSAVTVQGGGGLDVADPSTTRIDANDVHRAFEVQDGGALILSDVWVEDGAAGVEPGGNVNVLENSSLLVRRSTLTSGTTTSAFGGGGIYVDSGSLTIRDSVISFNGATANGGGVTVDGGKLTVARSLIDDNDANLSGGGIALTDFSETDLRTHRIIDSTFSDNQADADINNTGDGGGLFVYGDYRNETLVTNSTITNNFGEHGDGVAVYAKLTMTNSTIALNGSAPRGGLGGGIFNQVTLTLNNVTVSSNISSAVGGTGGNIALNGGTNVFRNVLVGAAFGGSNCTGMQYLDSLEGTNIEETGGGNADCGFDITTVDADLGPLGDNGGPTQTIALLAGSEAISQPGDCPATDQRGAPRSGPCDVGAYQRVTCQRQVVNVVGTRRGEMLEGGSARDGILGLGGNDVLRGLGDRDGLCGDAGNDRLEGGGSDDRLDGGANTDLCIGGAGTDVATACEETRTIP